jgi:cell division protein FtsQ
MTERGSGQATMLPARRRFVRRQWARRWRVWRGLLVALLVAAVAAGAVWLVFYSPALAVADVEVQGGRVLSATEVRRAAAVPVGDPLATVNLDAVAARVEGLAPVKKVDVTRSWPDSVLIDVEERVAVAAVVREGQVRGLDADGVIFRDYEDRPADLPLVRMSASTESEALAEAASVVAALPEGLAGRVAHVEVDTVDTISLRLRNGDTVFWGSADASEDKARVVQVLLKQDASRYDVSVPAQPTITR